MIPIQFALTLSAAASLAVLVLAGPYGYRPITHSLLTFGFVFPVLMAGATLVDRVFNQRGAADALLRVLVCSFAVVVASGLLLGTFGWLAPAPMATDATKNGGLRAMAFNDASLLTAIGNDIAFEDVFALPLNRIGQRGDLLISISSSGDSPNIVKALETGRRIGMSLVTLSGQRPDNRSRILGDLNFYVPADRYGWVECAHQLLIHYWFDQYLNVYGNGAL